MKKTKKAVKTGLKSKKSSAAKPKKAVKKLSSTWNVSLEELLEAGCHFGHAVSKIHPRMRKYIYTARQGVHIFDLVKTRRSLIAAAKFLSDLIKGGGKVVFVGTKRQAAPIIGSRVKGTGMFYIKKRWIGGLLTNWSEVKKNLEKLSQLEEELKQERRGRTKYEQLLLKREYSRLKELYGGISGLTDIPQALFIVDIKAEKTAVSEAKKMGIPVVAIVDSNSDPQGIDYVIPANDDAKGSIDYIVSKIIEAIKKK